MAAPRPPRRPPPSEPGADGEPVERVVLGELERKVLEYLWAAGRGDVKSVHDAVGIPRGVTANTVQSTLERLFRKQLLGREKVSHAYVYAPAVARTELVGRVLDEVVREYAGGEPDALVAAFVDLAARAGDGTLARLSDLVAARRRQGRKP